MLTLKQFDEMPAGEQFATGVTSDNEYGINMSRSNRMLRFVAVKGYANDWCVYCHFAEHDEAFVREQGDKVTGESNIRHVVPCGDAVLALYRY